MADTDFTLTFKTRYKKLNYYPVIYLKSASKLLVKEVNSLLIEQNINPYYLVSRTEYYEKRDAYYESSSLDINGNKNLKIWMEKIGFTSQKHLTKYQIWKKFGFCSPYTNIIQRRAILNGELDINFYSKPL